MTLICWSHSERALTAQESFRNNILIPVAELVVKCVAEAHWFLKKCGRHSWDRDKRLSQIGFRQHESDLTLFLDWRDARHSPS